VSFPKGRSVLGCIGFRRTPDVVTRINEVATEIGLAEHLDVEGAFLSHGQKQWLEIGMLLMQEPELLMLDEPVAGMSPAEREQTAKLIKRIAKGRSIIIIEHDMEFVSSIADKVTVLHLGKLLAEGTMSEIKINPKVVEVYLGH
jgi:urea transport system ATP-binding protein